MPENVCMGATLQCTFGAAPSKLVVLPLNRVMTSNVPAANIMPFGMCKSPANPTVAAATAAAMGTLTPMPCVPSTPAPWAPGSPKVLIANMPALNDSSKLMCIWAGVIEVSNPGQTTHQIP